jgi:hypothetical protein
MNSKERKFFGTLFLALVTCALLSSGCTKTTSSEERTNEGLKAAGMSKSTLGKVAGSVTIDGKTLEEAGFTSRDFVALLYDLKNPPSPKKPLPFTLINPDGSFEFSTYDKGDGVPVGSYMLLFDALKFSRAPKREYHEPDRLKDLYNDPEKSTFAIEVSEPGKTDYQFNLELEGKEKATPGPKAVTRIELGG